MATLDFLAEGNICGQTLLRLVARGSSIIAELLRLTDHVPTVLLDTAAAAEGLPLAPSSERDPSAAKYAPILFDFRYLKTPEMFDKQINTSIEMGELDDEFYETHEVRV
jgi:WASH complex subunit strumpellin